MNYEDMDINVKIPILCIHGNHDDPSGLFTKSAYDVLASYNLVNYGGIVSSLDSIQIDCWVFNEQVAIYLLGNIRDRRLYQAFVSGRVVFNRHQSATINILVLHQNRVPYGVKDYIPYEFLPDWFDLVIYGHEHESALMNLDRFVLMQPGSTVRTSLAKQEGYDKCVYLLETDTMKIERIILKTARPFFICDVEPKCDNIEKYLIEKVESILESFKKENKILRMADNLNNIDILENSIEINKRNEQNNEMFKKIKLNDNDVLLGFTDIDNLKIVNKNEMEGKNSFQTIRIKELKNQLLPLIRLRVKITEDVVLSNYKFGLRFKDCVANYNEILSISRTKKIKNEIITETSNKKSDLIQIIRSNLKFEILGENCFIRSLSDFIEKDDKNAFNLLMKNTYKTFQEELGTDVNDLDNRIENIKNKINDKDNGCDLSEIIDKNAFTDLL